MEKRVIDKIILYLEKMYIVRISGNISPIQSRGDVE